MEKKVNHFKTQEEYKMNTSEQLNSWFQIQFSQVLEDSGFHTGKTNTSGKKPASMSAVFLSWFETGAFLFFWGQFWNMQLSATVPLVHPWFFKRKIYKSVQCW